eukprot:1391594-Lingulodinium_polyedra.AAC.1
MADGCRSSSHSCRPCSSRTGDGGRRDGPVNHAAPGHLAARPAAACSGPGHLAARPAARPAAGLGTLQRCLGTLQRGQRGLQRAFTAACSAACSAACTAATPCSAAWA